MALQFNFTKADLHERLQLNLGSKYSEKEGAFKNQVNFVMSRNVKTYGVDAYRKYYLSAFEDIQRQLDKEIIDADRAAELRFIEQSTFRAFEELLEEKGFREMD